MKTTKFYYAVEEFIIDSKCVSFNVVSTFPTLAMARSFCQFNKGHYRISCFGNLEYKDGLEVRK